MPLTSRFTEHPTSVGESYGEHLRFALRYAADLAVAAGAAASHALFPWTCETAASERVRDLYARLDPDTRADAG